MRVAVVGAGISGLTCAGRLANAGFEVLVLEKSRGPSGRMATRRAEPQLQFDHGAQYFTVRDPRFERVVQRWIAAGVAAQWDAKIAAITNGQLQWKSNQYSASGDARDQRTSDSPSTDSPSTDSPSTDSPKRLVGTPRMSAIGRHLEKDVPDIHYRTRVAAVSRQGNQWRLSDDRNQHLGEFDTVLITAPAAQAAALLTDAPSLHGAVQSVSMDGCWAAMLAYTQPLGLRYDAAFINESTISWIVRDNSKPGRPSSPEMWVVHAAADWSNRWADAAPDEVLPQMLDEFAEVTGADVATPDHAICHRWRYAIVPEPLEDRCMYDEHSRVGVGGDWCGGPRVEGAYLSGLELADRVAASHSQ